MLKKKNIQFLDWGQIEWIYEPEYSNSMNVMHIGIVNILPWKKQTRHIHYGDEQVLYVLSGRGKQLIEDKISTLEPGGIYHIEAGSVHETINVGDEPIKEILISIPAKYEENLFIEREISSIFDHKTMEESMIQINDEIHYLYKTFIDPLKIPVTIFDKEKNIIIHGKDYPELCRVKCSIHKNTYNCPVYHIKDEYAPPYYTDLTAFVCPYGLTIFVVPIVFNNRVIGLIKGGHIQTSKNVALEKKPKIEKEGYHKSYGAVQIVPKSRIKAMVQIMKQLSKNIVNYYIFKNTELELNKKEEIISDIVKNEILLEKSLKSTKDKVLSIQINNHFLFNTLNAIAGLAIKENAFKTYDSIIDISNMLRYTLKNNSYFVLFKNEIAYLKNYINLQKLRYGEKLQVDFQIASDVDDKNIPCNCLQPIIENCFKHGFENMKGGMHIQMEAEMKENYLHINITDNGKGMNKKDLKELKNQIQMHQKYEFSGLMMIYSKLELFFEKNFIFQIHSDVGKGTSVTLKIPHHLF